MKKNSIMVKKVLMSIVAAGMITFGFTACSENDELSNEMASAEMEREYNGPALEPYGLSFQEFITPNDVQILNADTTQISVSKALAEKLGIKSFAGHPMGIWENMDNDSYMCKATKEKLVGDRYILDVVPASLAELLNGKDVRLSSDLFVNQDAQAVRSRAAADNIPEYAAKFIDEENVIHPMALTVLPSADSEKNPTRSGITAFGTFSTEDIMMARQSGSRWWPYNKIKKFIEDVYDWTKDKTTYNVRQYHRNMSLINVNTTFSKKIEFGAGNRAKKDTFNVNVKCPIDFGLNCNFILDASGSLVSLPKFNRFETSVAGEFAFAPQVTLGFCKKFSIPEDKQRLKLHEFPTFKLKFTVGPIPVTIDIQPYLFLKFEAEVAGQAYMGVKYEYASHFKVGAEYTKGKWGLINSYDTDKNKVSMIPPTGEFKAHAGIGLMLGCDVIVQKLAGPKIAIGPKLTADAKLMMSQDPDVLFKFNSSVDFGMVGEIGAKLKVWKWELADWDTDIDFGKKYNIFHYDFPHKEGDTENGSLDNIMKLLKPFKSDFNR